MQFYWTFGLVFNKTDPKPWSGFCKHFFFHFHSSHWQNESRERPNFTSQKFPWTSNCASSTKSCAGHTQHQWFICDYSFLSPHWKIVNGVTSQVLLLVSTFMATKSPKCYNCCASPLLREVVSVSLGKVTKERREDRLRQNKWKWLAYWTVCNPSLGLQNPQKSWRMSEKFLRSFVYCCCRFSQFGVDFNPSDWDFKFALVSFFCKINVSSQCQFTYAPAPHNSWISKL